LQKICQDETPCKIMAKKTGNGIRPTMGRAIEKLYE
jgi:hypothetical protein